MKKNLPLEVPEAVKLRIFATQRFLMKTAVPMMYERVDGRPEARGTGTFFEIDNRYFLIFARHFFDVNPGEIPIDPYRIVVPLGYDTRYYLYLGNLRVSLPTVKAVDVGIIELTDGYAVAELKKYWLFLTLRNVAVGVRFRECWIVGYPGKRTGVKSGRIIVNPLTVKLDPLLIRPKYISPPLLEGIDFLLSYPKKGEVLGSGVRPTPGVLGVSGASIWAFLGNPSQEENWSPEKCLKVIGIQSAWAESSRFIRGKAWWAIAESLAKLDHMLANAVSQALS